MILPLCCVHITTRDAPNDSTRWYWWTWYVNSALGAQVLSTCSTQWAWWLPDLITISPAYFRKKNSQQQEPNSDTIPPPQNRCPFPPQLQPVAPCSYPDFTLSLPYRTESGGPIAICFPLLQTTAAVPSTPACRQALKGAGSLSADMLQCRTAPAAAAYQLKAMGTRWSAHIESLATFALWSGTRTVMFQTFDLVSLHVQSGWAKKYFKT